MDKLLYCAIVLLVHTTSASAASAEFFFHEPSYLVLKPKVNLTATLDFGFAMGHQEAEKRLVVGAPHADQVGRVYGCHMGRELQNTNCEQLGIDVKQLASDYDQNDTKQNFYLGATIATTSKNFLTCAPLWTTGVNYRTETRFGSFGTCFVYYNKTNVLRVQGLVEQEKDKKINDQYKYSVLYGGLGWSSLADEKNGVLLIGKPFDVGDIQYITDLQHEERDHIVTKSLYFKMTRYPSNIKHTGYALAAGYFFNQNTVYYAFSVKRDKEFSNKISFLWVLGSDRYLVNIAKTLLSSKEHGDMFGAFMHSADLNTDGLTDLFVGAPTHSILGGCETGALYIYLGGEFKIMQKSWLRVESDKPRSRFGTAIATGDLDGDAKPEVIVSAPYEDFGVGAVYILSGNEVLEMMTPKNLPNILKLKDLKGTQRIQKTEFMSFGFSLQIVSNINENGCDGLAVGSPQSGSVTLLQCVPTIDAALSIKALNQVLKTTDTSLTLEVCVKVVYYTKSKNVSTRLQVTSEVYGKGAKLLRDKFAVDLSVKNENICENVTVQLRPDERDVYNFKSKVGYLDEDMFNQTHFDSSWVRLRNSDNLQDSVTLNRTCVGTDCIPELKMELLWGGSNTTKEIYVEERTNETVTVLVKNFGASVYSACVSIEVVGAQEHIKCQAIEEKDSVITCALPSPVARNSEHELSFVVDINKVTNVNDAVHIKAKLFAECLKTEPIHKELDVKFIFAMKNVYIADGSHSVPVTETQVKNGTNSSLVDKLEYKIVNNGSLLWENVAAIINVPKKNFIQNYSVLLNQEGSKCVEKDTVEFVEFLCTGMKLYRDPILLYLRTTIPYQNITENLKVNSSIELRMASSNNTLNFLSKSQTTTIYLVKDEVVIGNNKTAVLIIVIVAALVILAVVAGILYKVGFFQRKELSRLDSLKENVKRKQSQGESDAQMPSTSGAGDLNPDSKEGSLDDFDIEVVDDSPFEAVELNADDQASLIVEDKPAPKIRTKSTTSQLSKRKASTASHSTAGDADSSKKQ